jgi:replicative superfamily II helicase
MDEQECVKADVALSCFIRAVLKSLIRGRTEILPQEILVKDFNAIMMNGLNAIVKHPQGQAARQVCRYLLKIAWENASEEERRYLSILEKRVECGSLSEIIRNNVLRRAQKMDFREAVIDVYSKLTKSLIRNEPYF